MFDTKFFKDLDNIREWTMEEYDRIERADPHPPERTEYREVLGSLKKLNEAMREIFYDDKTFSYRKPEKDKMKEEEYASLMQKYASL